MYKNIIFLCGIGILSLLILPQITAMDLPNRTNVQQISADDSSRGTTLYYFDVNILMISKLYESIEIDGFHDSSYGKGYDDKITLQDANKIFTFGIAIIWDDSGIQEWGFNGGWIHTKLEIFNYYGWISCQNEISRMKMYGDCKLIKITVYRG